jgi:hypothetical protein
VLHGNKWHRRLDSHQQSTASKAGAILYATPANPFFVTIKNEEKSIEGFEATLQACKVLGLDISNIPKGILQAFYMSGLAFADQSGMSPDEKRRWRESVLSPITHGRGAAMKVLCQLAKK